jgi:hypothetical protein
MPRSESVANALSNWPGMRSKTCLWHSSSAESLFSGLLQPSRSLSPVCDAPGPPRAEGAPEDEQAAA